MLLSSIILFYQIHAQALEKMCLSLEHQTRRKPLKTWLILIALQFRYTFYTANQRLRARKIGLESNLLGVTKL